MDELSNKTRTDILEAMKARDRLYTCQLPADDDPGQPLEVMKRDNDLLPSWAICLIIIALFAVCGGFCALVMRL